MPLAYSLETKEVYYRTSQHRRMLLLQVKTFFKSCFRPIFSRYSEFCMSFALRGLNSHQIHSAFYKQIVLSNRSLLQPWWVWMHDHKKFNLCSRTCVVYLDIKLKNKKFSLVLKMSCPKINPDIPPHRTKLSLVSSKITLM